MNKSKKKRRAKQERELKDKLYAFLKDYGGGLYMQTPDNSETDRQLQSIATFLTDQISLTPKGTVVDIGCGRGVLLARLANLPTFQEKESWSYLGIDYPEMFKIVINYAVETGIHRSSDFVSLDDFYSSWPDRSKFPRNHTVVIRNVFHELGIDKTASHRGGPHFLDSWAAYLRWIPMVKFMPPDSSSSDHYTLHQA